MGYVDMCIMCVVQDKLKRATVGPLPGVTQDIAGFKVKPLFCCYLSLSFAQFVWVHYLCSTLQD